jgi:hypothetical protein
MKSTKVYIKIFCLLSLIIAGIGCKREEPIGAEYVTAPDNLEVLSFGADKDAYNLANEPVKFSGKLSHRVSWIITLKGTESGAVKEIRGLSDSISPATTTWNGNHDGLYFFKKGETVVAELSFIRSKRNLTREDSFVLNGTRSYGNSIVLFYDGFEYTPELLSAADPGKVPFDADTLGAKSIDFPEDGERIHIERFDTTTKTPFRPVQGNNSFYLYGVDGNKTYFIAGVRHYYPDAADTIAHTYFNFPPGTTNEDLYFNFYIYGTGNGTTRAAIACAEDDNGDNTYVDKSTPGTGFVKAGGRSEDVWEYPFKITWTGWKLMSVRYSDFQRSVSPDYGGTGNGVRQLKQIKKITFNLLSDPPGNAAEYYVDFPIITFGAPFDPTK